MADEKEYGEIVKEQAEKLQEALKKKKKKEEEAAFDSAIGQIAVVVFGGPVIVVVVMAVGLILCEAAAFVYSPSNF